LNAVPSVPVIPPLLPSGEGIALEPARFDKPSLAALRGDVKLPYIGPTDSRQSQGSFGSAPADDVPFGWKVLAVFAVLVAISVPVVLYAALR
jgi:hypothetical protein